MASMLKETNSKHEPNHCLDLLFEKIGRRPRVGWDGFHRINHAGVASMRSSEEATEFFAVLHELQPQFGYGQGRSAARAVADVMGIRMCRHRHGGGTRKFIYLSKAVDSFLNNFHVFVQTIRLRKHHAETQHRIAHSNAWWAALARRVTELTMCFSDIFRPAHAIVVPYALELQWISALARETKRHIMFQQLNQF